MQIEIAETPIKWRFENSYYKNYYFIKTRNGRSDSENIVILTAAEYRAGGYGGNVPPGQPHPQKQRKNKNGTYLEQVERKEVKNYEKI